MPNDGPQTTLPRWLAPFVAPLLVRYIAQSGRNSNDALARSWPDDCDTPRQTSTDFDARSDRSKPQPKKQPQRRLRGHVTIFFFLTKLVPTRHSFRFNTDSTIGALALGAAVLGIGCIPDDAGALAGGTSASNQGGAGGNEMSTGVGGAGGSCEMAGVGGAGCQVDITTDPANCGACGVACGTSQICAKGVCQTLTLNWTQKFPVASPVKRYAASAVFDTKRQVVVLFGGRKWSQMELNDTWEWDGVNWTQVIPTQSPPGRDNASMVYDESRGVVVLFGGNYGSACTQSYNDTWEYDGTTWTQINTLNAPEHRWATGMAYDANRKVSVLFGGSTCGTYGDTWEYNGTNWTLRETKNAPSLRLGPMMTYDPIHAVTMLHSGNDGPTYNDTWLFDGTNWKQPGETGFVPPRTGAGIAYQADLGVSVLFGGWSGFIEYGDTHVWNGRVWTAVEPQSAPSPRDQVAMAWDGARHEIVLFGGNNVGTEFSQTWVLKP